MTPRSPLPVDHAGPLPMRVVDPSSLRPGAISNYGLIEGDQGLILKTIPNEDMISRVAYLSEIATGKLTVLPPVDTPADSSAEIQAVFDAELAAGMAKVVAAQKVKDDARIAKITAQIRGIR